MTTDTREATRKKAAHDAEVRASTTLLSLGFAAETEKGLWGAKRKLWKHKLTGVVATVCYTGWDSTKAEKYRIRLDRDPLRWRQVGLENVEAIRAFVAQAAETHNAELVEEKKLADRLDTAHRIMSEALKLTTDEERARLFVSDRYGMTRCRWYNGQGDKWVFDLDADMQIKDVMFTPQAMSKAPGLTVARLRAQGVL